MKITLHAAGKRGSAVLIVLALVIVMESFILANTRTLDHLDRELRIVGKRQQHRLSAGQTKTLAAPVAIEPGKSQ